MYQVKVTLDPRALTHVPLTLTVSVAMGDVNPVAPTTIRPVIGELLWFSINPAEKFKLLGVPNKGGGAYTTAVKRSDTRKLLVGIRLLLGKFKRKFGAALPSGRRHLGDGHDHGTRDARRPWHQGREFLTQTGLRSRTRQLGRVPEMTWRRT